MRPRAYPDASQCRALAGAFGCASLRDLDTAYKNFFDSSRPSPRP
ncbi:hypothetical protein [Streptomyces sp. NPDC005799]